MATQRTASSASAPSSPAATRKNVCVRLVYAALVVSQSPARRAWASWGALDCKLEKAFFAASKWPKPTWVNANTR